MEFVNCVSSSGYCSRSVDASEFVEELNTEFLRIANGCLNFARDYPDLLWSLPREDVKVVVDNGTQFLFKDALTIRRRMKSFLACGLNDVLESDRPTTVDIMRFLLSYACLATVSSDSMPISSRVESSVRKLFGELVNSSGFYVDSNASVQNQFPERYEQVPRSLGKNIETKRGDWVCPSFVNFAWNFKCRECEEPGPKKFLTGGEWECPRCHFFNFSRNAMCLRCDGKKPVLNPSQSFTSVLRVRAENSSIEGQNVEKQQQFINKITRLKKSSDVAGSVEDRIFPETMQLGDDSFAVARNTCIDGSVNGVDSQTISVNINMEISRYLDEVLDQGSTTDMSNIGVSLSENKCPGQPRLTHGTCSPVHEHLKYSPASQMGNKDTEQAEKSEEWFKKVAQLHDVEDLASAISDEDFPDTMPMLKGENRFAVSKKKDRSLISPMYERRMAMEQQGGNNKYVPFVPFPPGYFARDKPQEGSDSRISSPDNGDKESATSQHCGALSSNSGMEDTATNPVDNSSNHMELTQRSDLSCRSSGTGGTNLKGDSCGSSDSKNIWRGRSLEGSAVKEPDPLDMSEEAKVERWFWRVAQIKDISELSQIPDEDFPSIMPMRKGVNRFVVSKRKTPWERRLTSSQYRRSPPVVNSDPAKKETYSD